MSKKGIEKALGVGDRLRELEDEENEVSEDEKKERAVARKKEVAKIKAEISKLRNNNTDEDFVKEGLRELASIGLQSMRVLQDEVEVDPSGRAVECMAAMANATNSALKNLQNVDLDKEKVELDREKVNIKKNQALPNGSTVNNVLVTGSMRDVLQAMKDGSFSNQDEVDIEKVKEIDEENSKGSPFKK
jgi:hypothetical protein